MATSRRTKDPSAARRDRVWQREDVARAYLKRADRSGAPWSRPDQQLEVMRRVIAGLGRPVRRFADLGCGGGAMADVVREVCPKAHAVLVDFSEPMLRAARERFGSGSAPASFIKADLARAGWTKAIARYAPFDLVVSGRAVHHLPDARKRTLYREVFGLLAPGGLFLNLEHVASHSAWAESLCTGWVVDALYERRGQEERRVTRAQVAKEYAERQDRMANILAPAEEQCDWLREIGFQDVEIFAKAFEFALFGGRARGKQSAD